MSWWKGKSQHWEGAKLTAYVELWRERGPLTSHSHPEEMVPQRSVPWELACSALLISRQFILKGRWNRICWPRELPLGHQGGPHWPSPHLPEFHHTKWRCPGDCSWGEVGVSNNPPACSRSWVVAATLPCVQKHLWEPCSREVLSAFRLTYLTLPMDQPQALPHVSAEKFTLGEEGEE